MSTTLVQKPQTNLFKPQFEPSDRDIRREKTGQIVSALGLGGALAGGLKLAHDKAWFGKDLITRGDIPAIGAGVGLGAGAFLALSLSGRMLEKDEDLMAVGVAALGTAAGVGSVVSFSKAFGCNYWVGTAVTMGVIGMTHLISDAL